MRWPILACQALLTMGLSCPAYATGLEGKLLPPIVLRMDKVSVQQSGMPSTSGSSGKTAKEVFWLSMTALLTFGAPLLDLPNVLERGAADARPARMCLDSWKAILDGPKPWLKSTDVQEFVLQTVRGEAARLVANRPRPVMVEVAAGGTNDAQGAEAISEIGVRLSTPSLVLTDVSVGVEPLSSGCAALFRATAKLHVESTGAAKGDTPSSATVSKSEAVDVHGWSTDPEVGRRALRIALLQLADEIVKAYPWPPGDENPLPLPSPTGKDATAGTGGEP